MPTAEEEIARLRTEIVRLGVIVDAARMTDRNVSLERALIVDHASALLHLQLHPPRR